MWEREADPQNQATELPIRAPYLFMRDLTAKKAFHHLLR